MSTARPGTDGDANLAVARIVPDDKFPIGNVDVAVAWRAPSNGVRSPRRVPRMCRRGRSEHHHADPDTVRVVRPIARVRHLAAVSLALLACSGCESRLGTSSGDVYLAPAAPSESEAPSGQAQGVPPVPPLAETAPGLRLSTLEGGRIIAQDGQLLGIITGRGHKESIANQYGDYDSSYSPTSMFNRSGTYGSPHSSTGAMHPHTPFPPRIYVNGKPMAYVTANRSFRPSIHPKALREFAETVP